jgi:sulfonate transport system ATP-binding protein
VELDTGPADDSHILIEGLSKTFTSGNVRVEALSGISLRVRKGAFVSIIGASGCGKSTLLRIIGGLETEYEGTVLFDGKPVRAPSRGRGFIFQDNRLLPWLTVEGNIKFSVKRDTPDTQKLIREKLEKVSLAGFENAYPRQLSGGMAQRVAIARALANQPQALLLDEPFGALDAITKIKMQEEMLSIWESERITMILVTHDIDEAVYLGEEIVVMGNNPGTIRNVYHNRLPPPRNRLSAEFTRQKEHIYKEFFATAQTPFVYSI